MSVYIDQAIWEWRGLKWAHLLADDIDELHRFAARLGIHRTSYQGPPKTSIPHYDLTGYERRRAIASGAIACSRYEIVAVVRRLRPAPAVAARRHDPLRASDVSSTASAQNSLQA
jgi:Protein of unknown function (DUF4031)